MGIIGDALIGMGAPAGLVDKLQSLEEGLVRGHSDVGPISEVLLKSIASGMERRLRMGGDVGAALSGALDDLNPSERLIDAAPMLSQHYQGPLMLLTPVPLAGRYMLPPPPQVGPIVHQVALEAAQRVAHDSGMVDSVLRLAASLSPRATQGLLANPGTVEAFMDAIAYRIHSEALLVISLHRWALAEAVLREDPLQATLGPAQIDLLTGVLVPKSPEPLASEDTLHTNNPDLLDTARFLRKLHKEMGSFR